MLYLVRSLDILDIVYLWNNHSNHIYTTWWTFTWETYSLSKYSINKINQKNIYTTWWTFTCHKYTCMINRGIPMFVFQFVCCVATLDTRLAEGLKSDNGDIEQVKWNGGRRHETEMKSMELEIYFKDRRWPIDLLRLLYIEAWPSQSPLCFSLSHFVSFCFFS